MKLFIVLAALVAVAVAAPAGSEADAQILQDDNNNIGVGPFNFASKTSNGISQEAEGNLKNVGTENEALEVRGQFSYTGPDGIVYTVTYIANEFGFQPSADHIPRPA